MKSEVIDPVTLEVIWNRLLSVANEQQDALIRTAFSTIVRESQALACGMFDTRGRMIAQSISGTPGHINAMATSMKHFLAAFPSDRLAPGVVLLTNDPWQTAGQINDITITTPIFKNAGLVALVANSCHSAVIGERHLLPPARDAVAEEIIRRSENAVRGEISKLPGGEWASETWSDGFEEPILIRCTVRITGDEIFIDFTGSSPQSTRGINVVLNYTHAYASFAIKAAICPDVPHNEGSFRPVHVSAP